MSRIPSRPSARVLFGAAGLVLAGATVASAVEPPGPAQAVPAASAAALAFAGPQTAWQDLIVHNEAVISRDEAALMLELRDGRAFRMVLADGRVRINGEEVGAYAREDVLDRSWRDLLNGVMTTTTSAELARLLQAWEPPAGDAGDRLRGVFETVLATAPAPPEPAPPAPPGVAGVPTPDTLDRLQSRIRELERTIRRLEDQAAAAARAPRQQARRGFEPLRPLGYIATGILNILRLLAGYVVLVGLGFAAVFFGRRYLEGVADTARHATVRAGLVGLAAMFLILPAFIVGMLVLTISIIGIPLVLVWIFAFPTALVLACVLGYLGVAHAAGEALAEHRFHAGVMERANSFYYVLTGVGILMALFLAAHIVGMAGPWFAFLRGTLNFLGGVLTFLALSIGLGAVLISRAGTQPVTKPFEAEPELEDILEEEARV